MKQVFLPEEMNPPQSPWQRRIPLARLSNHRASGHRRIASNASPVTSTSATLIDPAVARENRGGTGHSQPAQSCKIVQVNWSPR